MFGEEITTELVDLVQKLKSEIAGRLAGLESRLTWRVFVFCAPVALAVIGTAASLLLRT